MRFLSIDYGNKKVGLAISDTEGQFAFPFKILKNDQSLTDMIHNICGEEDIEGIVLGKSLNEKGEENLIMGKIKILQKDLEKLNLPVFLEKEFMTTIEARGREGKEKNNARKVKKNKQNKVDDKAAALILQRFLDKRNKNYAK